MNIIAKNVLQDHADGFLVSPLRQDTMNNSSSSSDQDSNAPHNFTDVYESFPLKSSTSSYETFETFGDDIIAILTDLDDNYELEVQMQQQVTSVLPPIQSIQDHPKMTSGFVYSKPIPSLTSITRRVPPPPYQESEFLAESKLNPSLKCNR